MFDLGGLCVVSTFSLELSGEVYFSRGLYSDQMSAMDGGHSNSHHSIFNGHRKAMTKKRRIQIKNNPETILEKETRELTEKYAINEIEKSNRDALIREGKAAIIREEKEAAIIRGEEKETEEKQTEENLTEEKEAEEELTEGGKRRKTRRSKRSRKTKKRKQKRSKKVLTSSAFQKIKNKK